MPDTHSNHFAYQPATIEFVTVAAELCRLLENTWQTDTTALVRQLRVMLPLLYAKTQALQSDAGDGGDEYLEQFVFEDDYETVRTALKAALGQHDTFLDSFHPDMAFTPEPPAADISEYIADIYQEIKDMAGNFQTGDEEVMKSAVEACRASFDEHWGRKLISALAALHAISDSEMQDSNGQAAQDNNDDNSGSNEDEDDNTNYGKFFNHNK